MRVVLELYVLVPLWVTLSECQLHIDVFPALVRPDMTFAVDWALSNNYLSCVGKTRGMGLFLGTVCPSIAHLLWDSHLHCAFSIHTCLSDLDLISRSQQHWKCEIERSVFLCKFLPDRALWDHWLIV